MIKFNQKYLNSDLLVDRQTTFKDCLVEVNQMSQSFEIRIAVNL